MDHPAWAAVGASVVVERRIGHSVAWRKACEVERHTKTNVVLNNGMRFRKSGNAYVLTPAYLDYSTTLLPREAFL
jgi:hypothetical protein